MIKSAAALPEDLGSIPIIHMTLHKQSDTSVPRYSISSFGFFMCNTYPCYTDIHADKLPIGNKKKTKGKTNLRISPFWFMDSKNFILYLLDWSYAYGQEVIEKGTCNR